MAGRLQYLTSLIQPIGRDEDEVAVVARNHPIRRAQAQIQLTLPGRQAPPGRRLQHLHLRIIVGRAERGPAALAPMGAQPIWRSRVVMSEQIHSSAMSPPAMR